MIHRDLIIGLTNRARIPTIFPFRTFPINGGLMSWGTDFLEIYRQAGNYVDKILRGAKPNDLPVQAPTKFELVINLRTARALGLQGGMPLSLFAMMDSVMMRPRALWQVPTRRLDPAGRGAYDGFV